MRVVLLSATNSVNVARFTRPRQTCFAATCVTPVYGVTPEVSIHATCSNLFFFETGLNVGGKTSNFAFQLVLHQCCKASCTFLLPVLPRLLCSRSFSVAFKPLRKKTKRAISKLSKKRYCSLYSTQYIECSFPRLFLIYVHQRNK